MKRLSVNYVLSKGVLILAVRHTAMYIVYFHTFMCICWFWYNI